MAQAAGIGGFFFRAQDPDALAAWYLAQLGVGASDGPVWMQAAGPTVFTPFRQDSDYFPADRAFMLNFRVDDLDGLLGALRAAGIGVETRADWDGDGSYGRFARIHDPEGNPIELWEPPAT
ncbi:MAG TPA: VOC family protein [Paracoccaceae bacterium]|nr:VOC family protein [Paracoccaceae bacterium]HMO70384.1 VOC family protein [Paracoccaceae bacterium]